MDERAAVTCFLEADGRILIVRRSQRVSTYQGRWSAISGTIDPGRTPEEQAWQEIAEETSLGPPGVRLLATGEPFSFVDRELDRRWVVHPFRFAVAQPEQVRLDWENLEGRWIDPADLAEYPTVPYLREVWERVAPGAGRPEAVERGLADIRADRERGASELADRALTTLGLATTALPAGTPSDLHDQLTDLARELGAARPAMAPIAYWTGRFADALPDPAAHSLADYRQAASQLADSLRAEARAVTSRIVEAAAGLIRPGTRVATASYSSLVAAALLAVPVPFHLSALASVGPDGRSYGRQLIDRVSRPGLTAELTDDTAVAAAGRTADLVLIGADAVWPDGSVVNGVPSRALAEAAHAAGRPVYALAQRAKMLASPADPEEPGFEVVPAGLLTAIITEDGPTRPP